MSEFYDDKKKCRKTAWNTPEHLGAADWATVAELIEAIESNDPARLYQLLSGPYARPIFYRILGWPEGLVHCRIYTYVERTALYMLQRHDLQPLKVALAAWETTQDRGHGH